MALIYNGTGVTSKSDIQIQFPAQYIGIQITGAASFSDIQAVQIEASLQGPNGTLPFYDKGSLEHFLELFTPGSGNYKTSSSSIEGSLELSPHGAINFTTGQYLSINLYALTAAMTVNVYGMEGKKIVKAYNRLMVRGLDTAGTEKTLQLPDASIVSFIRSTTSQIRLQYPLEGRTLTFLPKELDLISTHVNEIVSVDNTGLIQNGYKNLYTLPVDMVNEVRVTNSSNTSMYVVQEMIV